MKFMVNVTPFPKSQDPLKVRTDNHEFVEQAKKYLENRYVSFHYFCLKAYDRKFKPCYCYFRYKLYMSTVIKDHLREAQRSGVPSTYKLVGSYVGLKFNNQNTNTIIGKY